MTYLLKIVYTVFCTLLNLNKSKQNQIVWPFFITVSRRLLMFWNGNTNVFAFKINVIPCMWPVEHGFKA